MKKNILTILSLFGFAATIWSYCSPPPDRPQSCNNAGHPNVPDSTYSNVGYIYSFTCCNQTYQCGSEEPNPGLRFSKQMTTYFDSSGNYCTDLNNAVNKYDQNKCCGRGD